MKPPSYTRQDLDHSPLIVFYEMTRACDLACIHCRADAQQHCDPGELSPADARRLVDELLQFPRPPLLVLTGGDPLKRPDVFDLIRHARQRGVETAMTPSATSLATTQAIAELHRAGLHRLAISLDGDAATHDAFRRVPGSYQRTLQILADARHAGLPVQVNTTVGRHNLHQLDHLHQLISGLRAVLWSVFFIVPTGRATAELRLSADECESVFRKLWRYTLDGALPIKTTEAPHYRRFILQQQKRLRAHPGSVPPPPRGPMPPGQIGTNDGKGVMFISHTGEIYPSGFLPLCAGKFPMDSPARIYREAALFRALRDPDRLGGKCGRCEYRAICGGSRARAFALTCDPLASEPDCLHEPRAAANATPPAGCPSPDPL